MKKAVIATCAMLAVAGCNGGLGKIAVDGEGEGRSCMIEADKGSITKCECKGPKEKFYGEVKIMSTVEELCSKILDG